VERSGYQRSGKTTWIFAEHARRHGGILSFHSLEKLCGFGLVFVLKMMELRRKK